MNDAQTESVESAAPAGDPIPATPTRLLEEQTATDKHGGAVNSAPPDEPEAPASSVDSVPIAGAEAPARSDRVRRQRTASLFRSFRTGRALEGRVEQVIKGGYAVKLGKIGGFCPHSQIGLARVAEPEALIGKTFLFRITQLRRAGEDVVVSRRTLLEEERREEAKAVRATLIEGAVMQGHVAGLAAFGAFVDLGAGVMGLVHVSELSHGRVRRVEDVVKVGQSVLVKVLRVDDERGRLSLSLRQAQADPWESVEQRFRTGEVYPGTAVRTAEFGAFVELVPGVEALAPAGEFPPSRTGWKQGVELGTQTRWLVLSVDAGQRRMSIAPLAAGQEPLLASSLQAGADLRGKVQRVEAFGVFVWLAPGCVGLMPNAASGTSRGADMQREFPVGDDVEVVVLEVEDGGRRIRLVRKGVQVQPPQRPRSAVSRAAPRKRVKPAVAPRPRAAVEPPKVRPAFGSLLADKLKAALD